MTGPPQAPHGVVNTTRRRGDPPLVLRATRPSRRTRSSRDGLNILTVYVVLLLAVPSSTTITVLGSIGRPSIVWGLVCALWWLWGRLQGTDVDPRPSAVRRALLALLLVVLCSYGLAQLRGLPPTETSPADAAILRLVSWSGVCLLTVETITTAELLRALLRRLVLAGVAMACLGLAQFFTGSALLPPIALPGLSAAVDGVQTRSGLTRSAATATNPLEYASVLAATAPLAVALALGRSGRTWLRWVPALLLVLSSLVAVSRSAILGLVVGFGSQALYWPRRVRLGALAALFPLVVMVYLLAPGVLGTVRGLFTGIDDDPSTASRTRAYGAAADVAHHHLLLGRGLGTFLPEYQIFDNQYLQLLVEVGVVGLLAFLTLLFAALVSARSALRAAETEGERQLAAGLGAAVAAVAVLYAFFDALSFPMAAGVLMLLVGAAGAASRVGYGRPHHEPAASL